MAKQKKKVVLIIVEGECDETLLIERLREKFVQHDIRFEPQRGDIFYNSSQHGKPIRDIIGDKVREILIKRKFKQQDILAVLHILDTDGCFIPEDSVIVDQSQLPLTLYKDTCISVPTDAQKNNIILRNNDRSRNIRTMNSINKIVSKKYNYQLYFFSRNLEHVIFDDPNPSQNEKLDKIESFIEELEQPIEEFLAQYMPRLSSESYEEQYIESWNSISTGSESLKRFTSVPLLFQYIELNK
ncbi:hypothetical protein [Peribacillus acanthi]|uniref:hypothetical protein n=1 Tax=Peribacillus acanthi TaxID=2171554 RepID=UPI000D3E7E87|nr:hypothetical protein [Peribacillus acanthi]